MCTSEVTSIKQILKNPDRKQQSPSASTLKVNYSLKSRMLKCFSKNVDF